MEPHLAADLAARPRSRQSPHGSGLAPRIDIGITPHVESIHPEAFGTERGRIFRRGLVAASSYLAREGHLDVPRQHTETDWIGPFRLGSWIDHIRRTPNELTDEERPAPDILRMSWNTPEASEEP